MKVKKYVLILVSILITGIVILFIAPIAQVFVISIFYPPGSVVYPDPSRNYIPELKSISIGLYEIGEVSLKSGEKVNFWFTSHHNLLGGVTLFRFVDGTTRVIRLGFCCDVYFTEQQIANRGTFSAYLDSIDGVMP